MKRNIPKLRRVALRYIRRAAKVADRIGFTCGRRESFIQGMAQSLSRGENPHYGSKAEAKHAEKKKTMQNFKDGRSQKPALFPNRQS